MSGVGACRGRTIAVEGQDLALHPDFFELLSSVDMAMMASNSILRGYMRTCGLGFSELVGAKG